VAEAEELRLVGMDPEEQEVQEAVLRVLGEQAHKLMEME
jgi:hypothetical protein